MMPQSLVKIKGNNMNQGYLDIHTHILPSVDDGAQTMEEAMELLKLEYENEVRFLLFTPHYVPRSDPMKNQENAEKTKAIFEQVKEECKGFFPDMEVYLGNELYYKSNILQELDEGRANTLGNSHYILTEFSTGISFLEMKKAVQQYLLKGYQPILAHVERYQCLYRNFDRMEELKNMGSFMQMNTENFLEGFFSRNKKFCTKAVAEGYIDFLGTDCHNLSVRKPAMKKAVDYLGKRVDEDILDALLHKNPRMLLREMG